MADRSASFLPPSPTGDSWFQRVAHHRGWSALALLLLAAAFLLPGTASLPLMDRDEPRFAQATWEMMERGEWAVPYFNDEYRFDKPPLTYWWMRVHYWIFGKTEFAARLHTMLAAWLTAVVTAALGRRLFDARAGLLAGVAWLSLLQVFVHGRLCVADMPMLLAVTLCMHALAGMWFRPPEQLAPGRGWLAYLVGALTLGFLAKGPIAWAVPLLGLILALLLYRGKRPWILVAWFWLAVLFAVPLIGLWGVPALLSTKGAFWQVGIGEHVVKRGAEAFNGRITVPVVFYLVSAFISLLPWSAFAPAALCQRAGWRDSRRTCFLLGWFIAPFLIFGFYATQLPHYIMPGFPAFCLLLFSRGHWPEVEGGGARRWFNAVVGVFGLVGVVVLAFTLWAPFSGETAPLRSLLLLISGGVLTAGVALPLALRFRRLGFALGALVLLSLAFHEGGSLIRSMHPGIAAVEFWKASGVPEKTKFRASGFSEPCLVFYQDANGPWKMGDNDERTLEWFAGEGSTRAGIFLLREWQFDDVKWEYLTRRDWPPSQDRREAILGKLDPQRYETRTVRGYNAAKTSWVECLVVWQRPDYLRPE